MPTAEPSNSCDADLGCESFNDGPARWWTDMNYGADVASPKLVRLKTPTGTRPRLTKRYVARFSIDGKTMPAVVVVEVGAKGWKGVTAIIPSSPNYADKPQVRGGVLAYRRP